MENKLMKFTTKPYLKGFKYIVEVMEILKEDQNLLYETMNLYQKIAEKNNVTWTKVERDIRTAKQYFNKPYKNETTKAFIFYLFKQEVARG